MTIRQLSVFAENKPGTLVRITKTLGDAGVDIRAMSLADTQDFGILRLITSDPVKAGKVLADIGCVTSVTEVLAVEIPNRPGAMTELVTLLGEHEINIESLYAFITVSGQNAYVVLRVKNPAQAETVLCGAGLCLIGEEDINKL